MSVEDYGSGRGTSHGYEEGKDIRDRSNTVSDYQDGGDQIVVTGDRVIPQDLNEDQTQGSTTGSLEGFDNFHIPEQPKPEVSKDEPEAEEKKKSKLWLKIAAGVGAVAAAGGLYLGINHGKEDASAKNPTGNQPTTSAPAVAGGEKTAPSTVETGSQPIEATKAYTINTFPFYVNSERLVGFSEFRKSQGVSVAEYPTIRDALPAIADRLNTWMNSGSSKEEQEEFKNLISTSDGDVRTNIGATNHDFVDPGWEAILFETDDPNATADFLPQLTEAMEGYHSDNVTNTTKAQKDSIPYEEKLTIDSTVPPTFNKFNVNGTEIYGVSATFVVSDNGDIQPTIRGDRLGEKANGSGPEDPKLNVKQRWNLVIRATEDGYWKVIGVPQMQTVK